MSESTVEPHFEGIIGDIANGSSARKALESRDLSFAAFWKYLDANPLAGEQYARAKDQGLEVHADEVRTISDDVGLTAEEIAKARLQTENRKWLLARLKPSRYGDALNLKHSGTVGVKQLIIKDDDEK